MPAALLAAALVALLLALLVPSARTWVAVLAPALAALAALILLLERRRWQRVAQYAAAVLDERADEVPPAAGGGAAAQAARQLGALRQRLLDLRGALEHWQRLAEGALGQLSEGVAVIDAMDRIVYANAVWRHLTAGGSVVLGTAFYEHLPAAALAGALAAARAEGRVSTATFEHRRRHLRATLARIDGERVAVVLDDLTELRSAERRRREFVAAVSHELKTPLTAIAGFTETLLDGALEENPAEARRFVEKIARHCERLTALVRDVLTLSRLEQGAWEVRPEPCDLVELVRQIADEHQMAALERRVRIGIEAPPALTVVSDRELLHQLLGNLVSNAVRYNRPGGSVTIRVHGDPGRLRLQVIDTGIGIPPEHHDRIFERFYRIDAHRSRASGGTGLGLAIVKELVDTLHGTIGLASGPSGTTFTVELPVGDPRSARQAGETAEAPAAAAPPA